MKRVRHTFKAAALTALFSLSSIAPTLAEQAIVSTRTVYPGQTIEAVDLKAVILTKPPRIRYAFVTKHENAIGKIAVRTILPGRFIATTSLKVAPVVRAGEPVRVRLRNAGLQIEVLAMALADGAAGETIRLRNPASGKVFAAKLHADGSAEVEQI
ncbi:MAG: flagellar basal body P-ring formation chaperone FlgA [Pseudomonadota bacterium]